MKPLFLFSLPRAGSTLLQRMLATHPDVSTTAEPWLLLPQLYALRHFGVDSEYGHQTATQAIEEFSREFLPNGVADYKNEVRELCLRLYRLAGGEDARYFLDKTPRYNLIAEDIVDLFPEGRFVFLWRNPLAVISSMIDTWGKGKWNLYYYDVDLHRGLSNLVSTYERQSVDSIGVRYEDLISAPEPTLRRVLAYLDLPFDQAVVRRFNEVELRGNMWDPTGSKTYATVDPAPLTKWTRTLGNPIRKAWCRRYLERLGSTNLSVMGYDLEALLHELQDVPSHREHMGSDALRYAYGSAYLPVRRRLRGKPIKRDDRADDQGVSGHKATPGAPVG